MSEEQAKYSVFSDETKEALLEEKLKTENRIKAIKQSLRREKMTLLNINKLLKTQ